MGASLEQRLRGIGIDLPSPVTPRANFVPTKRVGNLLYVSGQVPVSDGVDRYVGKLGSNVSLEDGQAAARLCAVNILAH